MAIAREAEPVGSMHEVREAGLDHEDLLAVYRNMNLTLTYDHRLVDGALAGRFLRDLRERLETWDETNY